MDPELWLSLWLLRGDGDCTDSTNQAMNQRNFEAAETCSSESYTRKIDNRKLAPRHHYAVCGISLAVLSK